MSIAADRTARAELPRQWERLERLAEEAAVAVTYWRRRSHEAEEEVVRLRRALEDLASQTQRSSGPVDEVLRLRAENAALRSRMLQGRKRVQALLKRLSTLGLEL